jgi:Domain of unknown function (DUF4037)
VTSPAFIPGLELSRVLFEEAVAPLLAEEHPGLRYAAARVGSGSEVLGFDTLRSADHEWGPRLDLFLSARDADELAEPIRALLSERLPKRIRGWPTNFREKDDPLDPVGRMAEASGPVTHRVSVQSVSGWLRHQLGVDGLTDPTTLEWLAMPQQRLAEAVAGAVYRDDTGELSRVRGMLTWYPDQIWRYLLACQWQRISQQEAFVGRAAEVGDELGSVLVVARLARDLVRLALLCARRYAPYDKWLGSTFAQLPSAQRLGPHLRGAVGASDHGTRERELARAYEIAGRLHNETGLTARIDPTPRNYYGRPFLVLHAERFAEALRATISDPQLRALPATGGVDQWTDSTELVHEPAAIRAALGALATEAGVSE